MRMPAFGGTGGRSGSNKGKRFAYVADGALSLSGPCPLCPWPQDQGLVGPCPGRTRPGQDKGSGQMRPAQCKTPCTDRSGQCPQKCDAISGQVLIIPESRNEATWRPGAMTKMLCPLQIQICAICVICGSFYAAVALRFGSIDLLSKWTCQVYGLGVYS